MKHLQLTDELQERALLYASGSMSAAEERDYARHLEEDGCTVCLAESREFQTVAQTMALNLEQRTPSPSVKARLLAQVDAARSGSQPSLQRNAPRQARRTGEWAGWFVAAAAGLAVAVLFVLNSGLRQQVDSLTTRVAELEQEVSHDRAVLAMLTQPQVRVVNLSGQGNAPQARARIFVNEPARIWRLYVDSLPPAGAGRSYQLWFVPQTGNPVSAQVFNTGADGSANFEISVPPEITTLRAAAVTSEPEGGLPQPSGNFVLLGAME